MKEGRSVKKKRKFGTSKREGTLVREWTTEKVAQWVGEIGYPQYAELFSKNKIDGEILVSLEEDVLRNKPFEIPCYGDIKRISWAIQGLNTNAFTPTESAITNEWTTSSPRSPEELHKQKQSSQASQQASQKPEEGNNNGAASYLRGFQGGEPKVLKEWLQSWPSWFPFGETKQGYANVFPEWKGMEPLPTSLSKLFFSFCFILFVALTTSFVMTIVGDRVPDQSSYPPLPDIFLDSIPLIPIAFAIAELIILSEGLIFVAVLICHRHRMVVLRRFFAITGTVFLLRCATMFITSLSVPGKHLECQKPAQIGGEINWPEKFARTWEIFTGFGMSINGVRTCGDYMFSGHTSILTILNFFVLEYTTTDWRGLHIFSWLLNMFGMFFVLAAHEHYSIDVFMAYYLSSHMFLHYHNLANSMHLVKGEFHTIFPLFGYLEENTRGVVPNVYGL